MKYVISEPNLIVDDRNDCTLSFSCIPGEYIIYKQIKHGYKEIGQFMIESDYIAILKIDDGSGFDSKSKYYKIIDDIDTNSVMVSEKHIVIGNLKISKSDAEDDYDIETELNYIENDFFYDLDTAWVYDDEIDWD